MQSCKTKKHMHTRPTAKLIQPADPSARKIYWLNWIKTKKDNGLPVELRPTPEQLAVAIAKCSRNPTPFDQNIEDVSLEKAAEFHEKWVVGYGHGSVAEHAVASVAIQNIPQPVIKLLEDARLASFTEVSSRYQVFTRDRVCIPHTLKESSFHTEIQTLFDQLYTLYDECQEQLKPMMQERMPKPEKMSENAWNAVIKAMVCDRVRYLLPAAAQASLGMTANARVWEHVLRKLLSSPDPIAQKTGKEIKEVLRGPENADPQKRLLEFPFPTLLKYADQNDYLTQAPTTLQKLLKETNATEKPNKDVCCTYDDPLAERRIAAAIWAKYGQISVIEALNRLRKNPKKEEEILRTALETRGPHDAPLREFEHAWFQHEIIVDYGAWRDIQRHRMCTQANQRLGTELGYEMPEEIEKIGKKDAYQQVMREAKNLNQKIKEAGMEAESEYVVPMAYRRRVTISWNLRELFHFIELRSGKKGHPAYRRIAQNIWHTLKETHPLLASYIRVDLSETETSTLGTKPKGF